MSVAPAHAQRLLHRLAGKIVCPWCGLALRVDNDLRCEQGHLLRWRDGYLDASVPSSDPRTIKTLDSFGYEWSTFDKVQPEDEVFWERYFADVDPNDLAGKLVLDAGCGKGRFSYFCAPQAGVLIALDGSAAVDAAVRNLERFENTLVVKADLISMPFGPETFEFISCLGVLHHLTDPERGFQELATRLVRGGRLLIYVYSRASARGARAAGLATASFIRGVTVRFPPALLRTLSAPLASLLYVTFVLPGRLGDWLGLRPLSTLPLQTYRGRPVRSLWLDTFDRLSAPLERRYLWEELEPWFQRAGLEVEAVREDAGLIVLARRP